MLFFSCRKPPLIVGPPTTPPPPPNTSWSQCLHLHAWLWLWMKLWRCWRWRGGEVRQMAGLPPSCLLFGENNASLRALIKAGDGDLSRRTAGRQHASLPAHPHLPCPAVFTHTGTHTLQLTGTGHGLNVYQTHANKTKQKTFQETKNINPCLNYI